MRKILYFIFAAILIFSAATALTSCEGGPYTVSFDTDGGFTSPDGSATELPDATVEHGEKVPMPNVTPLKIGYTFDGWYLGEEKWTFEDDGVTADITLIAKWIPMNYTVSYKLNGGTNSPENPENCNADTEFTLKAPVREGYTFEGWYNQFNPYTPVTKIEKGGLFDIVLEARWVATSYKINYIGIDDESNPNPKSYTLETESFGFLPVSKTGYTFEGWYLDKDYTTPASEIAKGSMGELSIYGKFIPKNYRLSFMIDGAVISQLDYNIDDASFTPPAVPEKAGYVGAWESFELGDAEDISVGAIYTPVNYKINYENTHGAENENPTSYNVENTLSLSALDIRGYVFGGWYKDRGFTESVTEIKAGSSGDLTLYAKLTPISYTISYMNTKDAVNLNALKYTTEDTVKLLNINPSHYSFHGWYSDADLTEPISEIPVGSLGNITVYAKLTPNTYTISYDNTRGAEFTAPQSYNIESASIILPELYSKGYAFAGWYQDGELIRSIPVGSYGNISLSAKWRCSDGHSYKENYCSDCGAEKTAFTRVDAYGNECDNGSYILLGSYPQSSVTSTEIQSILRSYAGRLPTRYNSAGWTSYGYYNSTHDRVLNMWYIDISYGGDLYRGVYFTERRNSFQDGLPSIVHWYKFEPIKWQIVEEKAGKALLVAELMIDSIEYQTHISEHDGSFYANNENGYIITDDYGNKFFANDYSYSTISKWLNDEFYNTAFTMLEKELIRDNSGALKNIFLPSLDEIASLDTLEKAFSSYTIGQGVNNENGFGYWWLRNPSDKGSGINVMGVSPSGELGEINAELNHIGVVPAMWIYLEKEHTLHDAGEWITETPATEHTKGTRYKSCVECGKILIREAIQMLPPSGNIELYVQKGEFIYFGSYPQSKVTDEKIIAVLSERAGALPTAQELGGWSSGTDSYYTDVSYLGERYRGVYFTSKSNAFQSGDLNTVYWFKYEPIKWFIADKGGKNALLIAELLIDAGEYQKTVGEWLNGDFYSTAFGELEKTLIIDNGALGNVFLPSVEESAKLKLPFKSISDYAAYRGIDAYNGRGYWYLRDIEEAGISAKGISPSGELGYIPFGLNHIGISPAVMIRLEQKTYVRNENYIYFGSYPQSEVIDDALIAVLNERAGALPSILSYDGWTSVEYIRKTENGERKYMWYQDVAFGGERYRGIYLTDYKPDHDPFLDEKDIQEENGYLAGNIYWFKYEPIKWRILTEEGGKAFLLCEMLIDAKEFSINTNGIYADYKNSTIREWLNESFYNTAFSFVEKLIIEVSALDSDDGTVLNDRIFLPSHSDVTNEEYGFMGSEMLDTERRKETSDYAKCFGAYSSSSEGFEGNGRWWLRTPSHESGMSRIVYADGNGGYSRYVDYPSCGVAPSMWIKLY